MTKEQFEREKNYQAAMSIARNLRRQDLITESEYRKIRTAFLKKYRQSRLPSKADTREYPAGTLGACTWVGGFRWGGFCQTNSRTAYSLT